MRFHDPCYKCGELRNGELTGDDDCRYIKFACTGCGTKWTVNAPSVKAAKPTKGEDDGSGEKKD